MTRDDSDALRRAIAAFPRDVSADAHGVQAPTIDELYAPETHAAALDPAAPLVQGARGTGKSFWSGVLANDDLRLAAAKAYPRLGLDRLSVEFGFTGIGGSEGIDKDKLDSLVPDDADATRARIFWWCTVLHAIARSEGKGGPLGSFVSVAKDVEQREEVIEKASKRLSASNKTLLVVYDALDAVASTWPRRRMLTQALFEVVWSMRAWRNVRPKLFIGPDQLNEDALQFVELPKLRTGAVRLTWTGIDLYGLLFARFAQGEAAPAFDRVLKSLKLASATSPEILSRQWALGADEPSQRRVMAALAGPYMASGKHGYKKGHTYDWPLNHLADAFDEVSPRSFLALAIGASEFGSAPSNRVFSPEGIRHGLRLASQIRVDQLHLEFKWIKGVLTPLAGLLLPKDEKDVFGVWKRAGTVQEALKGAEARSYLSPFPDGTVPSERALYEAMKRIGVMFRRDDGRLDMPDLFRVAAKLLKRGGTAPV